MDPNRKRRIRFVSALSAAVVLAGALVFVSLSASSEATSPTQLLTAAKPGTTYQLTGKVKPGTVQRKGEVLSFGVEDRAGGGEVVQVAYTGQVPDPFREGREVIVDVTKQANGSFAGEKDSLVTKCPSKFSADESKQ